jgi:hypothetical protein
MLPPQGGRRPAPRRPHFCLPLNAARDTTHGTSAEVEGELLAHVTTCAAHCVAGDGQHAGELGHLHRHAGWSLP